MKSNKKILLDIKKLCVGIAENSKNKKLIKSVSFNIKKNEIVGLIGESGSGKSLTSLCILGLLEKKNFNISGEIYFNQRNIINLQENEIMKIRGIDRLVNKGENHINLNTHPFIAAYLEKGYPSVRLKWYFKHKKWIKIIPRDAYKYLEYHFLDENGKTI